MKTDTDFTRFVRWSLPGLLTLLMTAMFVALDVALRQPGLQPLYPSLGDLLQAWAGPPLDGMVNLLVVATAGMPLGFLIYQVYFFVRWNSPFSRDGIMRPLMPGRIHEVQQLLRDLPPEVLAHGGEWRRRWVFGPLFKRDHGSAWRYIELRFLEAVQRLEARYPGVSLYGRYRYLNEIMQTLGASIVAVYLGFAGYLAVKYWRQAIDLPTYLALSCTVEVGLFALLHRERSERERLQARHHNGTPHFSQALIPAFRFPLPRRFRTRRHHFVAIVGPGSSLILVLGLTHLLGNPVFGRNELGGRLALAGLISILWILSHKDPAGEAQLGDSLVLGVGLALAGGLLGLQFWALPQFDWPFFSALYVFLGLNLALFENRQNVRDDLAALVYYTLQRVATETEAGTTPAPVDSFSLN